MTTMDKIAKIRMEIERRKAINSGGDDSEFMRGVMACYTEVLAIFDSLQEEPVSDDLEEAAKEYGKEQYNKKLNLLSDKCRACYAPIVDAFKAGAKWQEAKDQETIELAEDHAMLAGMEKMREKMITAAIEWIRRNANIYDFRWVSVFREAMNKV